MYVCVYMYMCVCIYIYNVCVCVCVCVFVCVYHRSYTRLPKSKNTRILKATREVVLPRPYLFEKKEKDFYVCQSHPCVTDL